MKVKEVSLRISKDSDSYWIDLCDESGEASRSVLIYGRFKIELKSHLSEPEHEIPAID